MAELLERVSARELSEWMAYAQMEPFGEERADLRAAIVAMTVANVNRGKGRAAKVEDFMPKFDREPDGDQMKFTAERLNAMFGGRDLREKP